LQKHEIVDTTVVQDAATPIILAGPQGPRGEPGVPGARGNTVLAHEHTTMISFSLETLISTISKFVMV
jgi:hypothetical protein